MWRAAHDDRTVCEFVPMEAVKLLCKVVSSQLHQLVSQVLAGA